MTRYRIWCMDCDSGGLADDSESAIALAWAHNDETEHTVVTDELPEVPA